MKELHSCQISHLGTKKRAEDHAEGELEEIADKNTFLFIYQCQIYQPPPSPPLV